MANTLPAPTADTLKPKEARKTGTPAHSTRSRYLRVAGDKTVSAFADGTQYRPRESPANRRIDEGAGDAVGILLGFATRFVVLFARAFYA